MLKFFFIDDFIHNHTLTLCKNVLEEKDIYIMVYVENSTENIIYQGKD